MHNTSRTPTTQPSYRQLTWEEITALRKEGERLYYLDHIPRGQRNYAIYAVGQYLWGIGYGAGREDERMALIKEWLFARRTPRTTGQQREWEDTVYRAVHWKSPTGCNISDHLVEVCMATKRTPEQLRWANLKRRNDARRKIIQAYASLLEQGQEITRYALEKMTGCSKHTIDRHKDIWFNKSVPLPSRGKPLMGVWGPTSSVPTVREEKKKEHPSPFTEKQPPQSVGNLGITIEQLRAQKAERENLVEFAIPLVKKFAMFPEMTGRRPEVQPESRLSRVARLALLQPADEEYFARAKVDFM